MKISKYIPLFLSLIFIFLAFSLQAQCPMCRATAEKSEYAKSLNTGILYLLFAPVIILGTVLIIWIRNKDSFSAKE